MIVALFVLSLAMLLGGMAAIVQGIPFIRLEMGWTMVIAGAVVMSGGAILAGVSTAIWRLRRIERELVAAREVAAARSYELSPAFAPAVQAQQTIPRREPSITIPAPITDAERLAPDERAVLAAGDIAPVPAPPPDETRSTTDEAMDRLDLTPASDAWTPEAEAARKMAEAQPSVAPAEELRGTLEPEAPAPRIVAGTYSSGGNNYVMYSDGSIEAETPTGHYTFKSLEELKAFASREEAQPGRDVA